MITPRYFTVGNFSEGLAVFRSEQAGRAGFLNKNGEVAIPARYSHVRPFKNGRAAVLIDDSRVAFVDKTGAVVLQTGFEYVADFTGDLTPFGWKELFISAKRIIGAL